MIYRSTFLFLWQVLQVTECLSPEGPVAVGVALKIRRAVKELYSYAGVSGDSLQSLPPAHSLYNILLHTSCEADAKASS